MTRPSLSRCMLALLPLLGVTGGLGQAAAAPPEPAVCPSPGESFAAARGPGPSPNLVLLPTVAVGIGPTWSLVPAAPSGLAVDVTVGAVLGWPGSRAGSVSDHGIPVDNEDRYLKSTLWLQSELGYSYERGDPANPRLSGHLGSLGLGLGYGNLLFAALAYTPRLVLGAMGEELAVGLRHGLAGHFLGRLFAVELSHQMLWSDGELRHELRLVFGINAGALLINRL